MYKRILLKMSGEALKGNTEFGIDPTKSIYEQFVENPDMMLFVSRPETAKEKWLHFEP